MIQFQMTNHQKDETEITEILKRIRQLLFSQIKVVNITMIYIFFPKMSSPWNHFLDA